MLEILFSHIDRTQFLDLFSKIIDNLKVIEPRTMLGLAMDNWFSIDVWTHEANINIVRAMGDNRVCQHHKMCVQPSTEFACKCCGSFTARDTSPYCVCCTMLLHNCAHYCAGDHSDSGDKCGCCGEFSDGACRCCTDHDDVELFIHMPKATTVHGQDRAGGAVRERKPAPAKSEAKQTSRSNEQSGTAGEEKSVAEARRKREDSDDDGTVTLNTTVADHLLSQYLSKNVLSVMKGDVSPSDLVEDTDKLLSTIPFIAMDHGLDSSSNFEVVSTTDVTEVDCGVDCVRHYVGLEFSELAMHKQVKKDRGLNSMDISKLLRFFGYNSLLIDDTGMYFSRVNDSELFACVLHTSTLADAGDFKNHWLVARVKRKVLPPGKQFGVPNARINQYNVISNELFKKSFDALDAAKALYVNYILALRTTVKYNFPTQWPTLDGNVFSNTLGQHEPEKNSYRFTVPDKYLSYFQALDKSVSVREVEPELNAIWDVNDENASDVAYNFGEAIRELCLSIASVYSDPMKYSRMVEIPVLFSGGKYVLDVSKTKLKTGDVIFLTDANGTRPAFITVQNGLVDPGITKKPGFGNARVGVPKTSLSSALKRLQSICSCTTTQQQIDTLFKDAQGTLGPGGSGKSTRVGKLVRAIMSTSRVLAVACTTGGVQSLSAKLPPSTTVMSFERASVRHPPHDVLIIDEATVLRPWEVALIVHRDTKSMHLMGDPLQIGVIDMYLSGGARLTINALSVVKIVTKLSGSFRYGKTLVAELNKHPLVGELTSEAPHDTTFDTKYLAFWESNELLEMVRDCDVILCFYNDHVAAMEKLVTSVLRSVKLIRTVHSFQGLEGKRVAVIQCPLGRADTHLQVGHCFSAVTRALHHLRWVSIGCFSDATPLHARLGEYGVGFNPEVTTNDLPTLEVCDGTVDSIVANTQQDVRATKFCLEKFDTELFVLCLNQLSPSKIKVSTERTEQGRLRIDLKHMFTSGYLDIKSELDYATNVPKRYEYGLVSLVANCCVGVFKETLYSCNLSKQAKMRVRVLAFYCKVFEANRKVFKLKGRLEGTTVTTEVGCAACCGLNFTRNGRTTHVHKDYMSTDSRMVSGPDCTFVAECLDESKEEFSIGPIEICDVDLGHCILSERVYTFMKDTAIRTTDMSKAMHYLKSDNGVLANAIEHAIGMQPPKSGYDPMQFYPFVHRNLLVWSVSHVVDGKRVVDKTMKKPSLRKLVADCLFELMHFMHLKVVPNLTAKLYSQVVGAGPEVVSGMAHSLEWHANHKTLAHYNLLNKLGALRIGALRYEPAIVYTSDDVNQIIVRKYGRDFYGSDNRDTLGDANVYAADVFATNLMARTHPHSDLRALSYAQYAAYTIGDPVRGVTHPADTSHNKFVDLSHVNYHNMLQQHLKRLKKDDPMYTRLCQELASANQWYLGTDDIDGKILMTGPGILNSTDLNLNNLLTRVAALYTWAPLLTKTWENQLFKQLEGSNSMFPCRRDVVESMQRGVPVTIGSARYVVHVLRIVSDLGIYVWEKSHDYPWMLPWSIGEKEVYLEYPVILLDPTKVVKEKNFLMIEGDTFNLDVINNLSYRMLRPGTDWEDLQVQARTLLNSKLFTTSTVRPQRDLTAAKMMKTARLVFLMHNFEDQRLGVMTFRETDNVVAETLRVGGLTFLGRILDKLGVEEIIRGVVEESLRPITDQFTDLLTSFVRNLDKLKPFSMRPTRPVKRDGDETRALLNTGKRVLKVTASLLNKQPVYETTHCLYVVDNCLRCRGVVEQSVACALESVGAVVKRTTSNTEFGLYLVADGCDHGVDRKLAIKDWRANLNDLPTRLSTRLEAFLSGVLFYGSECDLSWRAGVVKVRASNNFTHKKKKLFFGHFDNPAPGFEPLRDDRVFDKFEDCMLLLAGNSFVAYNIIANCKSCEILLVDISPMSVCCTKEQNLRLVANYHGNLRELKARYMSDFAECNRQTAEWMSSKFSVALSNEVITYPPNVTDNVGAVLYGEYGGGPLREPVRMDAWFIQKENESVIGTCAVGWVTDEAGAISIVPWLKWYMPRMDGHVDVSLLGECDCRVIIGCPGDCDHENLSSGGLFVDLQFDECSICKRETHLTGGMCRECRGGRHLYVKCDNDAIDDTRRVYTFEWFVMRCFHCLKMYVFNDDPGCIVCDCGRGGLHLMASPLGRSAPVALAHMQVVSGSNLTDGVCHALVASTFGSYKDCRKCSKLEGGKSTMTVTSIDKPELPKHSEGTRLRELALSVASLGSGSHKRELAETSVAEQAGGATEALTAMETASIEGESEVSQKLVVRRMPLFRYIYHLYRCDDCFATVSSMNDYNVGECGECHGALTRMAGPDGDLDPVEDGFEHTSVFDADTNSSYNHAIVSYVFGAGPRCRQCHPSLPPSEHSDADDSDSTTGSGDDTSNLGGGSAGNSERRSGEPSTGIPAEEGQSGSSAFQEIEPVNEAKVEPEVWSEQEPSTVGSILRARLAGPTERQSTEHGAGLLSGDVISPRGQLAAPKPSGHQIVAWTKSPQRGSQAVADGEKPALPAVAAFAPPVMPTGKANEPNPSLLGLAVGVVAGLLPKAEATPTDASAFPSSVSSVVANLAQPSSTQTVEEWYDEHNAWIESLLDGDDTIDYLPSTLTTALRAIQGMPEQPTEHMLLKGGGPRAALGRDPLDQENVHMVARRYTKGAKLNTSEMSFLNNFMKAILELNPTEEDEFHLYSLALGKAQRSPAALPGRHVHIGVAEPLFTDLGFETIALKKDPGRFGACLRVMFYFMCPRFKSVQFHSGRPNLHALFAEHISGQVNDDLNTVFSPFGTFGPFLDGMRLAKKPDVRAAADFIACNILYNEIYGIDEARVRWFNIERCYFVPKNGGYSNVPLSKTSQEAAASVEMVPIPKSWEHELIPMVMVKESLFAGYKFNLICNALDPVILVQDTRTTSQHVAGQDVIDAVEKVNLSRKGTTGLRRFVDNPRTGTQFMVISHKLRQFTKHFDPVGVDWCVWKCLIYCLSSQSIRYDERQLKLSLAMKPLMSVEEIEMIWRLCGLNYTLNVGDNSKTVLMNNGPVVTLQLVTHVNRAWHLTVGSSPQGKGTAIRHRVTRTPSRVIILPDGSTSTPNAAVNTCRALSTGEFEQPCIAVPIDRLRNLSLRLQGRLDLMLQRNAGITMPDFVESNHAVVTKERYQPGRCYLLVMTYGLEPTICFTSSPVKLPEGGDYAKRLTLEQFLPCSNAEAFTGVVLNPGVRLLGTDEPAKPLALVKRTEMSSGFLNIESKRAAMNYSLPSGGQPVQPTADVVLVIEYDNRDHHHLKLRNEVNSRIPLNLMVLSLSGGSQSPFFNADMKELLKLSGPVRLGISESRPIVVYICPDWLASQLKHLVEQWAGDSEPGPDTVVKKMATLEWVEKGNIMVPQDNTLLELFVEKFGKCGRDKMFKSLEWFQVQSAVQEGLGVDVPIKQDAKVDVKFVDFRGVEPVVHVEGLHVHNPHGWYTVQIGYVGYGRNERTTAIAIPVGFGKTTLANKRPDLFTDHDDLLRGGADAIKLKYTERGVVDYDRVNAELRSQGKTDKVLLTWAPGTAPDGVIATLANAELGGKPLSAQNLAAVSGNMQMFATADEQTKAAVKLASKALAAKDSRPGDIETLKGIIRPSDVGAHHKTVPEIKSMQSREVRPAVAPPSIVIPSRQCKERLLAERGDLFEDHKTLIGKTTMERLLKQSDERGNIDLERFDEVARRVRSPDVKVLLTWRVSSCPGEVLARACCLDSFDNERQVALAEALDPGMVITNDYASLRDYCVGVAEKKIAAMKTRTWIPKGRLEELTKEQLATIHSLNCFQDVDVIVNNDALTTDDFTLTKGTAKWIGYGVPGNPTSGDIYTEVVPPHMMNYWDDETAMLNLDMTLPSKDIHLRWIEEFAGFKHMPKTILTEYPIYSQPAYTKKLGAQLNAVSDLYGTFLELRQVEHNPKADADEFARTYFTVDPSTLPRIGINEERVIAWLKERPDGLAITKEVDDILSEGFDVHPLNRVNVHLKLESRLKDVLLAEETGETGMPDSIADQRVRLIVWQQKGVTAIFADFFQQLKDRLKMLMPEHIVYVDGMTPAEISAILNNVHEECQIGEDDLKKQDRQTDKTIIATEMQIYKKMGATPWVVDLWSEVHNNWKAKGDATKFICDAMRITGQATTALGNVTVNLLVKGRLVRTLGKSLKCMLVLGDDNVMLVTDGLTKELITLNSARHFNMTSEAKVRKDAGGFLRMVVYRNSHGNYECGPDFMRLSRRYEVTNGTAASTMDNIEARGMSYLCMLGGLEVCHEINREKGWELELFTWYEYHSLVRAISQLYETSVDVVEGKLAKLTQMIREPNPQTVWKLMPVSGRGK
jgi:hypothetical protein